MKKEIKPRLFFVMLIAGMSLLLVSLYFLIFPFTKTALSPDKIEKPSNDLNEYRNTKPIEIDRITDYLWITAFDTILNREFLSRGHLLDSISGSPEQFIEILNMRPAKCKIEFKGVVGDTLKISIKNDAYLTEQMGSLGAECFIAETVFTLTEIDFVKCVKIEMDTGSHAGPGLFSRKDFERLLWKK